MDYSTPRRRADGLGSAKSGVHHWWGMRVTSVALIPLTILFLIPFAGAVGAGHMAVSEIYASPWNAIVAILFIAVTAHHLAAGLQVVIEDYVHNKAWRTGLLLGNTMLNIALAAIGIFAVAKIAFTA